MPLLVLQSFVNTWEGDTNVDLLDEPIEGPQWLREVGLADGNEVDLVRAREVRECIRGLLVSNGSGDPLASAALLPLRALAEAAALEVVVRGDGSVDVQAGEGDTASLASLLVIMRDAQRDGTWPRLKACRNPDCRWAYYDRSHAGRGAWCDMAVCGNRMKNRSLRSRRSGSAAPGAGS
jgi:predicted RNA-binding Zn ribbon-like protein